ncbi:hypothetical protein ACVGOW_20610 [Pseudonocardia saturnea]
MTVPIPGPPRPADPRPADPRPADPRAAVAAAMAGLDGLADRPLAEHVEAYERVHAALGDALGAGSA